MPDAKISSDELVTLEPTDFIPAIRGESNVRVAGSYFASSPLIAEYIVGSGTSSGTTHYVGGGSPITTLDITGLDAATAGGYVLLCQAINATNSLASLNLFFNGDTTAGNYLNRELYALSSGVGTGTGDACITQLPAGVGKEGTSETTITMMVSGKCRAMTRFSLDSNTQDSLHTKTTASSINNMTSISVISDVAGAIGIGSKFTLLRRY